MVVQDEAKREQLKEVSWGGGLQIPNSSHFVMILARKGASLTPEVPYIQNFMKKVQELPDNIVEMKTGFFKQFIDEDFKLNTDDQRYDWAKRQTYIPLGNMMTVAAMLGVDSCPIEGFHEDKINAILEKDFGVDTTVFGVSVMVAFGYRTKDPRPKTRQTQEAVVQYL